MQGTGYHFAAYYSLSYLLDIIDGPVARAMGQESHLGYYLDMVIDRISSCSCLHLAAQAVLAGQTCVPFALAPLVAPLLYGALILVEIVAHGVVMFYSEILGVHQKQQGFEYRVVRLYLGDKRFLFWGCVSFELFGLGLVTGLTPVVLLGLPGFAFRAVANLARLVAMLTSQGNASAASD